ncbi:MAG: hypothetical protein NC314_08250 [Roseburia sp.]|nr:hypothetical protein [Roseburia sp.]
MISAIKKTIFELYEYTDDNDRNIQNVKSNILDIILLFLYAAISFYNGINKISTLQISESITTTNLINILMGSSVSLLVWLNVIVLIRHNISLYKKIKEYKENYILEQSKRKRPVAGVRFPAWQGCLFIIWAAYLSVAVVLICILITGNNIIHPIGLIAIFTTLATFILELITDMENLFHIQPVAYERKRN